jgi:type I restriction enzyme S subunit
VTWEWHRLGDSLIPQSNGKPVQQGWSPRCHVKPAADGAWGVLKTTAIQDGRFEPEHNKELPEHLVPRPQLEVQAGDLLMTCAGPRARCGVPALVRQTPARLMMSGKMYRMRPSDRLLPEFLELWLRSPEAQFRIDRMKTGISDSGLNLTHGRFVELPVPVPPLDEQRWIVELLEDHLSRLDVAEAYIRAGLARAQSWQSRVIDQLVWSPEYPRKEVRSLLREPMRNGRSDRAVQGSGGGTRTLTLTAVTQNSFIGEHTKLTTTTRDGAAGLWLEPGDVFVQRSNTPELVGTSARFDGPRDWAIFPDLLIRLRADESVIDSRFLVAALRSSQGHTQLRRRAKGAAGSMPKIDQDAVGSALIPVPPEKEQQLIVAQVAAVDTGMCRLRAELERAQRRSAALRRSLLAAAFSASLAVAPAETATA